MLNQQQWSRYRNILNAAAEGFNNETIILMRYSSGISRYGEGTGKTFVAIDLNVLIGYNYFRTWPSTDPTKVGDNDKENMVAFFNLDYLISIGMATAEGQVALDSGNDYFIHRGFKYYPSGETLIAQTGDTPALYQVILRRQQKNTGNA
jgi:hypothetical protein